MGLMRPGTNGLFPMQRDEAHIDPEPRLAFVFRAASFYGMISTARVSSHNRRDERFPPKRQFLVCVRNAFGVRPRALIPRSLRSRLKPHCGPTNARLRAHLGLIVPDSPSGQVLPMLMV